MSLLVSTLTNNKSFPCSNAVYLRSDETIVLALSERSQGRFIDVTPAQDERIKQARARDMSLCVFVAYSGGVRA